MIAKILELIGIKNKWCVEFGAWGGNYLSNTWDLINNKSWSSVLVEGDPRRAARLAESYCDRVGSIFVKNAYVGWDGTNNLDTILATAPIPTEFDLLSIDIEGNDWHAWKPLTRYRLRLVVVEFNPSASNHLYFVQDPDPWLNLGSSLLAFIDLAKSKGYQLVACSVINAMFVLDSKFPKLLISDNSIDSMYEPVMTTEIYHGYDGTIFPAGFMRLTWHGLAWICRKRIFRLFQKPCAATVILANHRIQSCQA
jgi:hypothetical protein